MFGGTELNSSVIVGTDNVAQRVVKETIDESGVVQTGVTFTS